MKKIIFFNILLTLALFPYVMERWIHLPYTEGVWNLETVMVFGTFLMGAGLSLSNILLLISMKWTKYKAIFLKATMFFLTFLFLFPIYAGVLIGYGGGSIWVDILALWILYGNMWMSNRAMSALEKNNIENLVVAKE